MLVRRATPAELERVGALTVRAYAAFTLGPADPYVERLRDAASRDAGAELWVAVDGDRLLGNVTYCPPGSAYREVSRPHEGEFRMLAVDPDARGAGAGTALATHCEERAREHGAVGMAISSLAEMTDAHRIYGRLGYARDPGRDWSPLPGVELVVFAKAF
ncbi:Ribosomal protein S18 acetylase RimI [Nocardioides alpinus]|uniref:N-acetyltransferase n=1 Tax=Nocardioides alpinus TaxID=748909 RepID=A0A1I0Y3J1_9ACTN|nr:GNAT family N-acetyltransferase [Nocardioides alpinus]PKH42679.1 N-acetyltransferase [Nocardioides alpinus]SFB07734.1 Ribosomal protein S18 acetylase RimI [Nocardioides alpinus]